MFDLFFDSTMAFQSLMMLFGGLVCFGLGILLSADFVKWRLKATRVRGRIVSFSEKRSNGKTFYYPLVEYTDRKGLSHKVTTDVGSSNIDDRHLNKPVTVMYFESKEDDARILGSGWIMFVVGVMLLIGAGIFFYFGGRNLQFNVTTFVVAALLMGWAAFKLSKSFKPKEQWETIKDFKARRVSKRMEQETATKNVNELSPQEVKKKAGEIRSMNAKMSWFILLIGLIFCGFGYYVGDGVYKLEQNGMAAQGEVIGLKRNTDSDGDSTFAPIVKYQTETGKNVTFTSNTGSNPPSYARGDNVDVLYMPDEPQDNVMIDNGWWNWLLPAILGGVGLLVCLIIFPSMLMGGNKAR